MSRTAGYSLASFVFVLTVTGFLWPWLDPAGRKGILVAGLVALPVQIAAFGLLLKLRRRRNAFLGVWIGGTLARMGLLLVMALVVIRMPALAPAPTLLALVGYLFGMLLMEPLFFRNAVAEDQRRRTHDGGP